MENSNNKKNNNFVWTFFSELSDQISQIETPTLTHFLKQIINVLFITIFFSSFFFCISFLWIKFIVVLYKIGG